MCCYSAIGDTDTVRRILVDGTRFLVMELAEGEDLAREVEWGPRPEPA